MTDSIQSRLKLARTAAKLSQAEVAEAAGITQPAYSQLESGRTRKGTSLIPIARALGVDAHWLTSGRGKMHGQSIEDIRLQNLQLESISTVKSRLAKNLKILFLEGSIES